MDTANYISAKGYMALLELYNLTSKETIVVNVKKYIKHNNIKFKNRWLCDITGMKIDSINRYFSLTKIHSTYKFRLDHLCMIAIALDVSILDLLKE
jgi:hypothetical protein